MLLIEHVALSEPVEETLPVEGAERDGVDVNEGVSLEDWLAVLLVEKDEDGVLVILWEAVALAEEDGLRVGVSDAVLLAVTEGVCVTVPEIVIVELREGLKLMYMTSKMTRPGPPHLTALLPVPKP